MGLIDQGYPTLGWRALGDHPRRQGRIGTALRASSADYIYIEAMDAEQKTPRRDPGAIPTDMLAFNRSLIEEFRANRGQLSGRMAGRSLMLLTTIGSRTGQPRTTVVGYGKQGDRYIVIASANAAPAHPAWYRNLQANPIATVEVGAERFEVRAATAGPEEHDQLAAAVPWLEPQQKLTSREIPLVVLNRV